MALLAALAQIQWPRPSTYIHYYTYMYIYKALIRLCVCVCWVLRMRPVFTVLLTAFLSSNCNELHELALERKKKVVAAAAAAAAAARNTLLAKNL